MATTLSVRRSYTRVATIAKGGLGIVDLVVREEGEFQRLYARKRLQSHLQADAEVRGMFMREARLAGLIHHPNVVSVLDVGEDDEGPFFVMEYVEGLSLADVVARFAARGDMLPIGVALNIVRQAAAGLAAAHDLVSMDGTQTPLVHRDVSPQNLIVGFDGVVRVADFGIAKALGTGDATTTLSLRGKYGYMSPEQLRFEILDARSDLFSLGVVLWETVACKRLYPGKALDVVARATLHEPPAELSSERGDVPFELERLVVELLAKDRDARTADASTLLARLDALLLEVERDEGRVDLGAFMIECFAPVRQQMREEREQAVRHALADSAKRSASRRVRSVAVAFLAFALAAVAAVWGATALWPTLVDRSAASPRSITTATAARTPTPTLARMPTPTPAPELAQTPTPTQSLSPARAASDETRRTSRARRAKVARRQRARRARGTLADWWEP